MTGPEPEADPAPGDGSVVEADPGPGSDPRLEAGPTLLACRDLHKAFGGTRALDGVSLDIRAASVHALVGENGAGKSTLAKIVCGVIAPDSGEVVLKGRGVTFASPRAARDAGIAFVAQELALVPRMTAPDNVFLGQEPRRVGVVDRGALRRRFRALAADVGFDVPDDVPVGRLSLALRQQVEILRALASDAELLVLDEPSAALSGMEAEHLHAVIRRLVGDGRTVVLISHFLAEVLALADTITILRDGRLVRSGPSAGESESSLVAGMLGRAIAHTYPPQRFVPDGAPVALRVCDLVAPGVAGVSLEVREGEIVGLAGLIGAGRSELVRAIYGAVAAGAGEAELGDGRRWQGPRGALRAGLALIPESRATEGLMLGRPVRENVSVASLPGLSRLGWVRRGHERRSVRTAMEQATTQATLDQPAGTLSGGNQQKLLFARALLVGPRVLIADEPTRGVDVGAKRAIYELLVEIASTGVGILLVSSEMEEVLGLAHRVLVMRGGRVVTELAGQTLSEAAILEAAFATPGTAA
jgi:simple sugar transport system ATP-binding protein/ribose transport system ATP-binding protein